jgi:hypothetical protein
MRKLLIYPLAVLVALLGAAVDLVTGNKFDPKER